MYFFYKRVNIFDVFDLSLALSLALTLASSLALTMVFVIITMIGCDSSDYNGSGYGEGAGSGLDDSSSNAQLDQESGSDDDTEIPSDSLGESEGIKPTDYYYQFTERIITNPTAETRESLPVDMVIAVDVSSSMPDEINKVKTNLGEFYESIDKFTNTKVGMMVKEDKVVDSRRFSAELIEDMHDDMVHIDQMVIENSLWVLSAFIENKLSIQQEPDLKLKKEIFFREDSLKYFVVITDEGTYCTPGRAGDICSLFPEWTGVDHHNHSSFNVVIFKDKLISQFSKWGGIDKIRFVGIVSPKADRRKKYRELIGYPEISGKLYDVTAEDWHSHFTNLSEELITEATVAVRYGLGMPALNVSSVTIDGTVLARSDYHLDDSNHIVFKSGVLDASTAQNIDITYDTRKENPNPGWK